MNRDDDFYRQFLGGKTSAYDELMIRYGDSLTFYLYGYLHNWQDAEDLMIEAFARIIRSSASITEEKTFTYTFDPDKPALTITAKDRTLTYNGRTQGEGGTAYEDPAAIAEKVKVEGLREGDRLASVELDGRGTGAGSYELTAGGAGVKNAAGEDVTDDYIIEYLPGTLTIGPAKATITVNNASKTAGDDDPDFSGTVEGLAADGDLGKIKYERTNTDETPGTYAGVITAQYTANTNYDVTVKNGDFTIDPVIDPDIDPEIDPVRKGFLTFDLGEGTLDGKTGTITIEANVGDTIKLPGAPVRKGYTFQYWKGSRYEAGADYIVEGDHQFTAVWEKNKEKTRKADPGADKDRTGAKTGDENNAGLWVLLMTASLLALAFIRSKRRSGNH